MSSHVELLQGVSLVRVLRPLRLFSTGTTWHNNEESVFANVKQNMRSTMAGKLVGWRPSFEAIAIRMEAIATVSVFL